MKSRVQRWDLMIGTLASLVAIAGLLLNLAIGNTASVGFGVLSRETQKFMTVLAALFLSLVAIKAGIRYHSRERTVRACSIDALKKRRGGHGDPADSSART
jgi:hypothetical protein